MPRITQRTSEVDVALAAVRDALALQDLAACEVAMERVARTKQILSGSQDYADLVSYFNAAFGAPIEGSGSRRTPTSTGVVEATNVEALRLRSPR